MKIAFLLTLSFSLLFAFSSGESIQSKSLNSLKKEYKLSSKSVKRLYKKIKNDPENINDRTKLLLHYLSVNDKDRVKTLAAEIFKIKPKEPRIAAILKKYRIKPDPVKKRKHTDANKHKNDAFYTLKMYHEHGEYKLFLDLFEIMERNGTAFTQDILFLAIDSAIEMHRYKRARKIVESYTFPHTKNYKKFVNLLQQKLTAL